VEGLQVLWESTCGGTTGLQVKGRDSVQVERDMVAAGFRVPVVALTANWMGHGAAEQLGRYDDD